MFISAKNGTGLEDLLLAVEELIHSRKIEVDIVIPYSKYEAVSFIYKVGAVLFEEHTEEGTHIKAYLNETEAGQLKKLL